MLNGFHFRGENESLKNIILGMQRVWKFTEKFLFYTVFLTRYRFILKSDFFYKNYIVQFKMKNFQNKFHRLDCLHVKCLHSWCYGLQK